jgi:hypothetical protein
LGLDLATNIGFLSGLPVTVGTLCVVFLNTGKTITAGTTSFNMVWDTVQTPGSYVTYNTGSGAFTVLQTGYYDLHLCIRANSSSPQQYFLQLTGSVNAGRQFFINQTNIANNNQSTLVFAKCVFFTAGNSFGLNIQMQSSAANVSLIGTISQGSRSTVLFRGI